MLCTTRTATASHADLLKTLQSLAQEDTDYINTHRLVNANEGPPGIIIGEDDLLYKQESDSSCAPRLYIPAGMRETILHEAHDANISGHLGMDKTLERISRRFYWPQLETSVREYVRTCQACQRNKASNRRPAGLLQIDR